MADKKIKVVQHKANKTLKMKGFRATEPFDTEKRTIQLTVETGCGLTCEYCVQYKEGLCYGCYDGCGDSIRNCVDVTKCGVTESGEERACDVRCCKRVDIKEWIDDVSNGVGSLSIQNVDWEPFPFVDVPNFIPSINGQVDRAELPFVCVPLNRFYSARTDKITSNFKDVQDLFKLHPDTKVILNAYCQDPLLEKFWTSHRAKDHFQRIRDMGVEYALGFNYSVYHGHPRMEHLINIKRNFQIIENMQEAGFKVIPDLCWHNSADLKQFVEWINAQYLHTVSISLQLSRDNRIMARNLLDIDFMIENCPNVKRWIVNGPSTPSRISLLKERIPNLIIMNSRCYQVSKYNMVWDYSCNEYVKSITDKGELIKRVDAILQNYQFFVDLVNGDNLDKFGKDYF